MYLVSSVLVCLSAIAQKELRDPDKVGRHPEQAKTENIT